MNYLLTVCAMHAHLHSELCNNLNVITCITLSNHSLQNAKIFYTVYATIKSIKKLNIGLEHTIYLSTTQRFHSDHVLCTCQWKL